MPVVYAFSSKAGAQALENLTTNGTGNTETDACFFKPGATRPVMMLALRVQGKGNQLTSLSGLSIRKKLWTGGASTTTGATSASVTPKNNLAPAAVMTVGITSTAAGGVTSGSSGSYVGLASMGGSGPGGWVSVNMDDMPLLDGNASKSLDIISSCPTPSLNWEFESDLCEGI